MPYLYDAMNVDDSWTADDPEAMADHIQLERSYYEDSMYPDQSDQHPLYCSCRECMASVEQAESERRHFSSSDTYII